VMRAVVVIGALLLSFFPAVGLPAWIAVGFVFTILPCALRFERRAALQLQVTQLAAAH